MSIEGLNSILKGREQQYGQILGDKVGDDSEVLEEIKMAITALAKNQQKIYQKLDEISEKLEGK